MYSIIEYYAYLSFKVLHQRASDHNQHFQCYDLNAFVVVTRTSCLLKSTSFSSRPRRQDKLLLAFGIISNKSLIIGSGITKSKNYLSVVGISASGLVYNISAYSVLSSLMRRGVIPCCCRVKSNSA